MFHVPWKGHFDERTAQSSFNNLWLRTNCYVEGHFLWDDDVYFVCIILKKKLSCWVRGITICVGRWVAGSNPLRGMFINFISLSPVFAWPSFKPKQFAQKRHKATKFHFRGIIINQTHSKLNSFCAKLIWNQINSQQNTLINNSIVFCKPAIN